MGSLTKKVASLCSSVGGSSDYSDSEEEVKIKPRSARGNDDLVARDVYLEEEPIVIEINGQSVTVDTNWATAQTSLARYLRTYLGLTGTKIMCAQAGCGTCVVTATHTDPGTGQEITHSINSCVTPVFKCNGWKITTVEGLGNPRTGLNETQQRLHDNYGSQCGFCTSGMIMAMNSLLQNNSAPSRDDIKEVIDGNLCRCTGYRPIFDAFLSFSAEDNPALPSDIEELVTKQGRLKCPKTNQACNGGCHKTKTTGNSNRMQYLSTTDGEWIKPETLDDLLALLSGIDGNVRYQLVAGNTSKGVYPNDGPYDQYIDINGIPDLHSIVADGTNLLVGGSVTLNQLKALMEATADTDPGYAYCARLGEHLTKVAQNNVRNAGSVAGNLMMKWAHNDFESDVFNLLECVGATLNIVSSTGEQNMYSPRDFLDIDMDKKVILFISFPKLIGDFRFWTFKVTPRNQNAKAYVNGAMLANVDDTDGVVTVIETPRILLGGISGTFFHAENTENYLLLKNLNSQDTLNEALAQMEIDVNSAFSGESPPTYQLHLAKALLYKFFIFAVGDNLSDTALSSSIGQLAWERTVPESYQEITAGDGTNAPMYTAVKKLEGEAQVSGEAVYVDDIPAVPGELFAAYVCSKVGNCNFDPAVDVNIEAAMAMPGVVDYVSAVDIPGLNASYGFLETDQNVITEEIFSSGELYYAGQAIGLIVADTYEHARSAAQAVEITHQNQQPPVLSIADALAAGQGGRTFKGGKPFVRKRGTKHYSGRPRQKNARQGEVRTVSGSFEVGSQYHFHMETQSCVVRLGENGRYDIKSATQHMDFLQTVVANALGVDQNKIEVTTKRCGGAYGGKITLPAAVAAAASVAVNKLNKPVRLILDLQTNMEMFGKRVPYLFNYSADVDVDSQTINTINVEVVMDEGFSLTSYSQDSYYVADFVQNSYNYGDFNLTLTDVRTNTPCNTPCRAPVSSQCHGWAETLMEHIATELGVDSFDFRINNLLQQGDPVYSFNENDDTSPYVGPNPLPEMIDYLSAETKADYTARQAEVADFNANNAFRKRGIALVPMTWFHKMFPVKYTIQISCLSRDGSVIVSCGGIEMGQGLNTKVAQVVAAKLGFADISKIIFRPSDNAVCNNNDATGGSLGSDLCALSASKACDDLIAKIDEALGGPDNGPQDWPSRVAAAKAVGADVTGRHQSIPARDGAADYIIYGVGITEVEIDTLTGEKNVRRVDLMQNTGNSISPLVDLTQSEGAYVMALGLWMQEEITYDTTTGRLQNYDTWNYKPPSSLDIPESFRSYLYDTGENEGIFSSKATGEPPFLMGFSVMLALRNAINAAKFGTGAPTWYQFDGPAMNEYVQGLTGVTSNDFYI